MSKTAKRKTVFAKELMDQYGVDINFMDVGSGGDLKYPWKDIPQSHFKIQDFEPTRTTENSLPICISNENSEKDFYVCYDERSSSLHEVSPLFLERYDHNEMKPKKTIKVQCYTIDELLKNANAPVDCMDVNVEGHDFQVMQGATNLLDSNQVKLIKIEYELTEVWKDQGYFGDMDVLLRNKQFELVQLEVSRTKPKNATHIYYQGEVLWGKAYYIPRPEKIIDTLDEQSLVKTMVLYLVADVPGRLLELLEKAEQKGIIQKDKYDNWKNKINDVYKSALSDAIKKRISDTVGGVMAMIKGN